MVAHKIPNDSQIRDLIGKSGKLDEFSQNWDRKIVCVKGQSKNIRTNQQR